MPYLQERDLKQSLLVVDALSRKCLELGGPLTRQMYNLFRDGLYRELINFEIDYSWKFTSDDFLYARQIQAFLQKQDFLELGYDKKGSALTTFRAAEEQCRETNIRLESNVPEWDVGSVLYTAQRKIVKILGDVPSLDSLDYSFGPGATTSTKSPVACLKVKLSSRLDCSINLIPRVGLLLEELAGLTYSHAVAETDETVSVPVSIVPGKLAFVPKTCKTDRTIVVEPSLNGLIQKGIGSFMKKRLKLAGVDLRDQTRNQNLARKGSVDGTLCTIDLSSASDTVSREIVWSLLPYDWACLLDECRSPVVTYNASAKVKIDFLLEKFSSMGNAYTFELESLIFFALTAATCDFLHVSTEDVSVYGDDIICPVEAYDLLEKVLTYCGFTLNAKKSFKEGPFRESCGADFFNGIDIRPFYLKTLISDRVLFSMHNWFVRHCEFELANVAKSFINPDIIITGPDGYGDGHLIGGFELYLMNRKLKRSGACGTTFDTYVLVPKRLKGRPWNYKTVPAYVAGRIPDDPLRYLEEAVEFDPDVVRGSVGYKKASIYTHAVSIFSGYSAYLQSELETQSRLLSVGD